MQFWFYFKTINLENFLIKLFVLCLVKFLQQDWQLSPSICKYRSSVLSWIQFQFGLTHLSFYSPVPNLLTSLLHIPSSPPNPTSSNIPPFLHRSSLLYLSMMEAATTQGRNSELTGSFTHWTNIYWVSTLCQASFQGHRSEPSRYLYHRKLIFWQERHINTNNTNKQWK